MKRVLGIVPARGGSKRVVGKNLRELGGKPLVAWALEACCASERLTHTVLSSDDEAILAVGRSYATIEAMPRPEEIATDTAPAIAYVNQVCTTIELRGEPRFDAVAIVQPSSPFTLGEDIDQTIDLLWESGSDSAVSVMRVEHAIHPLKLKRLVGNKLEPLIEEERGRMSEHELPPVYVRNGSVYASRMSTIHAGTILGEDSRGYVMPRERSVDINDELDFALAEVLASQRARDH